MVSPISYLNTRLKLFEKVSLLLAVMVVVAGLNIVVIYSYHQQAEQVGNSVNIAGQQRMLSQRMVRLANEIAHGDDSAVARDRLRAAIERYDRNLEALTDGGTVTDSQLNPGAETGGDLPPVTLRGERLAPAPPSTEDELAAERRVWTAYEPEIRTILTADPDSAEFDAALAHVRTNSDELLAVSDAVTAEFARVIRERRAQLEQVLAVLLVLDLLVAGVGTVFARQYIGLPMAAIARTGRRLASGQTEPEPDEQIPIDRSLPTHMQRAEIAQLTRSFEAVREYHRTVSAQARALAEREFDDPVLEESVPGDLGDSLETMRADLRAYIDELRTTTEKLDAVIRASPAAILVTDPSGRVQRWNPAAEEIFGWQAADVEGRENPAVPEEAFDEYRQRLSEALVDESVAGLEDRWRTRDGETIDVSLSLARVQGADDELTGVMAVVEDITARKERERTLRRQRDELAMLTRVMNLVLEITQELIGSSSRDRIEDTVCRSLAGSDLYDAAWIGERRAGEEDITVRATAGRTQVSGQLALSGADPVSGAIRTAIETGELQMVTAPAGSSLVWGPGGRVAAGDSGVEDEDGSAASATVAAVPFAYRGTVYGVLLVVTDREYAYRDRERSGLDTLGQTMGFAVNAISNKKLLFADTVVDLTFDVGDTGLPLVPTTATLECSASLDGYVVTTGSGALQLFVDLQDTTASAFADEVVSEPAVEAARVIAEESAHHRVAVSLADDSILGRLSHHEASLRALELQSGTGTLTVEAPLDADVPAIVELLTAADEGVAFEAKTERDRGARTPAATASAVEGELTDRQYEVFKTAYLGGYFEWPRDSTIEELAANMGIAGSTFHHHLRHAQRKLARAVFDWDRLHEGV